MHPLSHEPLKDPFQSKVSRNDPEMSPATPRTDHNSRFSTPGRDFPRGDSTATLGSTQTDSQGFNGETPTRAPRGRNLRRLILKALQPCKGHANVDDFLPEDKLDDIMTMENVQNYVANNGDMFGENQSRVIEHVCGPRGRTNARGASRRIFAILLLIREPLLINDFIDQGIDDSDLPLCQVRIASSSSDSDISMDEDEDEDDYLARSSNDGPIIVEKFREWTLSQRQTFYHNQWRVKVPVLKKGRRAPECHPVHKFDKDVVLPWTEHEERYKGLSDVSRVRIHKAHCQLGVSEDQSFALKSLTPVVPQYGEQEFRLEVKAILKVKERPHLEVGLLTSFEHRDRFHLLFRWADGGNLRDLWMNSPRPNLTHSRICWMAQQLHGLAYGLDGIHDTEVVYPETAQISPLSPGVTQQSFDIVYNRVPQDDEGKNYGRHGDIKPQNILWFRNDPKNPEFGILKLADFGLTTFHRALTTGVKAEDVRVTNTYAAPEREIEETLSRPFDVWSLGCIFLEFATWILHGSKGVTTFEEKREPDGGHRSPNFQLDNFFTVFRDDENKYQAIVKPSVLDWIADLKRRPKCSKFLFELLDYVQDKMLQVRKEDRDTSKAVSDQLKRMLERCKGDEEYALRGGAKEPHQRKTTAKSKSAGPEMRESDVRLTGAKRKRPEIQSGNERDQGPASRTRSRMR